MNAAGRFLSSLAVADRGEEGCGGGGGGGGGSGGAVEGYGRLSSSVFFVSWSECATFTSLIQECSRLTIQPQESHAILARSVRLNAHKESKGKNKTKTRQATVENIFIKTYFCAQF